MVDFDLGKLSAPLEALRPEVDAAYKRLDAQWKAITDQLSKLPIPSEVSYTFDSNDYGPEYYTLDWSKWKGSKRVSIVYHYEEMTPDGPERACIVTPYEEWSAEQRISMLDHVPGLFKAAEKVTKEFVARINKKGGGK